MRRLIAVSYLFVACAAFAQNNRSAVSRNGLDTNTCTVASPCRSFAAAIAVTNPGGDIVALDSAGYGPFSIDRAITVGGAPGVHAAITAAGADAITVIAGNTAVVIIKSLTLTGGGQIGIDSSTVADLYISDCLIRGFTNFGIYASNFSGTNVSIERTTILDIAGAISHYGIYLRGSSGNPLYATVYDCTVSNSGANIWVDEYASAVIDHCTLTDGDWGVFVDSHSGTGAPATAMLENSTLTNNVTAGLKVSTLLGNNLSSAFISQNFFAYNTSYGIYRENNGTITSFGNNRFVDNGFDSYPAPPATASLK